jgi:glycosyltransferase involved in cell wall biosynthesis
LRILIVTDAWHPQINGVVRTLATVRDELTAMGHEVAMVTPDMFRTVPLPTYREIRLALHPAPQLRGVLGEFRPQAIHIATEGPLGLAARRLCLRRGLPFSTSLHTRFPEYVHARTHLPVSWGYAVLRWFHRPAAGVMVAAPSVRRELEANGFANIRAWCRGVDIGLFRPRPGEALHETDPRPVFLYTGRIAVEKNIAAFLALDLPGSKWVVGEGPQLAELQRRFPDARFCGPQRGEALARHFASADVFVFPSLTDTYGLVVLEALACGVPVACFPVSGPRDVLEGSQGVGALSEDLRQAALAALELDPGACRAFAAEKSWRRCAELFLANLAPFAAETAGDPVHQPG